MAVKDELEPFLVNEELEGFPSSGDHLIPEGQGAYGVVFKVKVRGVPCIAKRVHNILVNQKRVSKEERDSLLKKFRNECIVLSKLRHPNIVHFVGVHYGVDKDDLSLIMESLECDLGDFVETHPKLPLPLKLSVLLDVSYGLVYLHDQTPQIVHRDLSIQNVLMTHDGHAKIADLGVAKLLDPKTQAAIAHTRNPGNYFYMPPEAQFEHAQCSTKLDIFSFGHLSVYTVNQQAPQVFEVPVTSELQVEGSYQTMKRKRDLETIGRHHCLYPLIMRCLHDDPNQRPTTRELNNALKELCTKNPIKIQHMAQLCKVESANGSTERNTFLKLELEDSQRTIEDQKRLITSVTEEKDDTKSYLMLLQQQVEIYKEDFRMERKDREAAHSKLAELEMKEKELMERITIHQQEIKKLKSKRKWRRSHNTEELMPDPTEMAQRKMEEREQQYALEKEILETKNEQLMMEINSLKDLNQQLSTRVNSLGQEQADAASPLNSHDQTARIAELEKLLEICESQNKHLLETNNGLHELLRTKSGKMLAS